VIIRFQQCLSHRVPAIRPPCSQDEQTAQYARINGSFHISLEKASPPDPQGFQRQWLSQSDPEYQPRWQTLRDQLVDFIISNTPVTLNSFWETLDEAPLLLAEILFCDRGNNSLQICINNNIRAILPSTQLMAEQLMGQRLMGKDEKRPLKVTGVNAEHRQNVDKMAVHIDFTARVAEETVVPESAGVNVWQAGNPWQAVNFDGTPVFNNNRVTLNLDTNGAWQDGTIYQVFLNGGDDKPIVSRSGQPLMGWWDEPVNMQGRGRNVNVVRQWHLP
jgi:hypothetical protein